jgi:protein MpaA
MTDDRPGLDSAARLPRGPLPALVAILILACACAGAPDPDRGGGPASIATDHAARPVATRAQPAPRPDVAAASPLPQARTIGASVNGRPIVATTLGSGSDVVLILASIHGSEPAGTPLLGRLQREVIAHPEFLEGRTLCLVPIANPDGYVAGKRHNLRGVDLNRNFPASNFSQRRRHGEEPLSEPESQALFALIEEIDPDRVVSIHQPLCVLDYDGPAEDLARAMAEQCDLVVERIGSRPGSLGSYVGLDRATPIITVELPGAASALDADQLWQRFGRMLLAAIVFPRTLAPASATPYGEPPP